MKLKALFLIMFVAGVAASMAFAKPPPGHGNGNPHNGGSADAALAATTGTTTGSTTGSTTTGTTSTSTTATTSSRKVLICHRTGNGKYVLISVSVNSANAKGKHGDVPAAGGKCPASAGTTTGTTTTGTTTTGTTTTAATTTTG